MITRMKNATQKLDQIKYLFRPDHYYIDSAFLLQHCDFWIHLLELLD